MGRRDWNPKAELRSILESAIRDALANDPVHAVYDGTEYTAQLEDDAVVLYETGSLAAGRTPFAVARTRLVPEEIE